MDTLRIATRGSRLALVQARTVAARLKSLAPGLEVELVEIVTTGDRVQDMPLSAVGGSAFFTKEIETALLEGRADAAVHSLKDLASADVPGLTVAAVLEREDARDALVSASGLPLHELPSGAQVGTSSVRRRAAVRWLRPDVELLELRGNVPTRVRRLDEGRYDAVVLAAAGLRRLGMEDRIAERFDPAVVVPAGGQGAIAVQAREGDAPVLEMLARLDHAGTRARVEAERAFLRALGVGCQAPVGVHAAMDGEGRLVLTAALWEPDGSRCLNLQRAGTPEGARTLGQALADEARSAGGDLLLERARAAAAGEGR